MSVPIRTRRWRRKAYYPVRPSCPAKAVQSMKNEIAGPQVIKLALCDYPFVMDSWPFPSSRPRILGRGRLVQEELQSGIIVRGRMQPPQLLHTNNRGTPARDTGVAGALNPVPADQTPGLASGPGWSPGLGLSSSNAHSEHGGPVDVHLPATRLIHRPRFLLEVPNACVLWAPKQVTRSINKKRQCPGPGRICRLPSWVASIKGGVLFRHRRIGVVEMAICKIDTSFPLHGRQLLQAGPLPLKPPRTICSSTDSVTATRRLRLRELRWANLAAMHCQSCPRLSVARQVDFICFLAKLDRFLLGPSGC